MSERVTYRAAGYDCDFGGQFESADELVEMVRTHAKNTRGMGLSASDVRGMAADV